MWNVFNYGLTGGEAGQTQGNNTLTNALGTINRAQSPISSATDYFRNLLTAGRTQTAANAAPAINSALAGSDAARRAEAATGTGRSGGTTELNREAGATTQGNIDNIINQTQQTQQQVGSQGLLGAAGEQMGLGQAEAGIGGLQLSNASNLLGLGQTADSTILSNATNSRAESARIGAQSAQGYGSTLGQLIMAGLAL